MSTQQAPEILPLVAQIVSAHVRNNRVGDLPSLIQTVHEALSTVGQDAAPVAEKQQPAVPVKKSVFSDHLVCLEDGKKLKMLKRYLMTSYNMTPEQYREKWRLPPDYPMVAPNYAAKRSSLAKSIGLGRKRAPEVAARPELERVPEFAQEPDVVQVPAGRSGIKKASKARGKAAEAAEA